MPSAILAIQWDNYSGTANAPGLFAIAPLAYNSRQSRLHDLNPGDKLWLVSRAPDNQQYYIVAVLTVAAHRHNETPFSRDPEGSASLASTPAPSTFGPYAILADPHTSHDLHRRFPAEGILRALTFDTGKPIRHGANLGQSLQTLRFLTPADEQLLDSALTRNPAPFAPEPQEPQPGRAAKS